MSSFEKYRIHEVAKDFNLTSKAISEILTEYASAPKNHMQVLEANELDLIFEYLTQHNQMESIAEVFAVPAPKAPEKKPAAPQQQGKAPQQGNKAPQQQGKAPQQQAAKAPQQQAAAQQQPKREQKPHVPRQVAEKRIVDTRVNTNTNLSKYDEKFDNLAGDRGEKQRGGKEKFTNRNKQRQAQAPSNKRRQEEKDKMQRLQLEIAKKQPTKVSIPDEIAVGELASRMKKTAAEVIKQLIKLGVFASVSEIIDYDTAALVAMELGCVVEKEVIVTVEEHNIAGGLGGAVCEVLAENYPCKVKMIGVEEKFGKSGVPAALLEKYGLTAQQIADKVIAAKN